MHAAGGTQATAPIKGMIAVSIKKQDAFNNLIQQMKLKLLLTFLFIVFISCKKDKMKAIEKSEFVKTWFDTIRMVPFESKLIINDNKTFEYKGGACSSSFESKGSWKIEKDTLILNSSKTNKCYWKQPFGLMCSEKDFEKIQEDNKTIKDCNPAGENAYVIFDNEKFYIRNDTLIHTEKNKYCPKLKTAFSSVQKVR